MTAQIRETLGPQQNSMNGDRVWIVGSGAGLDDHNLARIRSDYIFALNAAYLYFKNPKMYPDAWWLLWDKRAYNEIFPRMVGDDNKQWPLVRCITHKHCMEDMRGYRGASRTIYYPKNDQFMPKRTIAETALLIADFLGFDDAYLVGVDGLVARDGVPYAEKCKWKRCHFMNTARKGSWEKSHASFRQAMSNVLKRLPRIRVWQTSTLYQGPEFKSLAKVKRGGNITFDKAVERRPAHVGTQGNIRDRKGLR